MCERPRHFIARYWAAGFTADGQEAKPAPGLPAALCDLLCTLHGHNRRLWRLEADIRDPELNAETVAALKRDIDRENQCRNDAMERIDEQAVELLHQAGRTQNEHAAPYSESPGSIADRLSVLGLRIAALHAAAGDAPDARLSEALAQQRDLITALDLLFEDVWRHRRRFRIGRKLKLY